MAVEVYDGRNIQIIDFDDATVDEHAIEFIDPAVSTTDAVVVVFNRGSDWSTARVTISPRVGEVSAKFLAWALGIARDLTEGRRS
jgi:hypothetical protein